MFSEGALSSASRNLFIISKRYPKIVLDIRNISIYAGTTGPGATDSSEGLYGLHCSAPSAHFQCHTVPRLDNAASIGPAAEQTCLCQGCLFFLLWWLVYLHDECSSTSSALQNMCHRNHTGYSMHELSSTMSRVPHVGSPIVLALRGIIRKILLYPQSSCSQRIYPLYRYNRVHYTLHCQPHSPMLAAKLLASHQQHGWAISLKCWGRHLENR